MVTLKKGMDEKTHLKILVKDIPWMRKGTFWVNLITFCILPILFDMCFQLFFSFSGATTKQFPEHQDGDQQKLKSYLRTHLNSAQNKKVVKEHLEHLRRLSLWRNNFFQAWESAAFLLYTAILLSNRSHWNRMKLCEMYRFSI